MTESAAIIASGLNGLMQQLDTVAHNVANAETAGFKRQVVSFQQEYEKQLEAIDGARSPQSSPVEVSESLDFSQGPLVATERPLDLGLEGKGFLVVETPNGPMYTRNGCMQINLLGQLVDLSGRIIAGDNGPINLPPTVTESELQVSADGSISAGGAVIGKLRMVDFGADENRLIPVGMGVFQAPNGLNPSPAESLAIRQGYQEKSNVQMVQEMVNMVTLSRLYEANMNVLKRQRENSQAVLGVANS